MPPLQGCNQFHRICKKLIYLSPHPLKWKKVKLLDLFVRTLNLAHNYDQLLSILVNFMIKNCCCHYYITTTYFSVKNSFKCKFKIFHATYSNF